MSDVFKEIAAEAVTTTQTLLTRLGKPSDEDHAKALLLDNGALAEVFKQALDLRQVNDLELDALIVYFDETWFPLPGVSPQAYDMVIGHLGGLSDEKREALLANLVNKIEFAGSGAAA